MKQILTLISAMLFGVLSSSACVKQSVLPQDSMEVTVLVMDTTQALLSGAEVRVGKSVFTTSYDGRVVLPASVRRGVREGKVSCKGYKEQRVELKESLVMVRLTPKASVGNHKEPVVSYGIATRGAKTGVLYKTMALSATASPAVEAEVMMDGAVESASEPRILPAYGAANNVSAGKLTAGEVNDFTKWALWANILDKSHKAFLADWNIEARERFTVQVMNKHGYPLVNYPVSLTDSKGNTLFQAVTDNTGKAELWSKLIQDSKNQGFDGLKIRVGGQVLAAQAMQSVEIDEECAQSDDVDVVFVFDATGSMGDELRYLQAEMNDVISRASQATGGLAIRTGAIVYRDHGDEYLTRISRLTDDIKTTQAFIDGQEANGGGDYPEAIPEALMATLNSSGWNENARARIAFLILDAPCHKDSATLALLHEQILNAASMGVRIVPVVCSGIGESGELLLRSMALVTNGTSFFLTDDSGIGNTHLKPTTDSLKVEHLNDMMVRTIVEFSYMPDCTGHWHQEQIEQVEEQFIPNPFSDTDIAANPSIEHGPTTLYLLDVSGKLITIYQGRLEEAGDAQLSALSLRLSTGIYFVKAYYDGEWHTRKILVH